MVLDKPSPMSLILNGGGGRNSGSVFACEQLRVLSEGSGSVVGLARCATNPVTQFQFPLKTNDSGEYF